MRASYAIEPVVPVAARSSAVTAHVAALSVSTLTVGAPSHASVWRMACCGVDGGEYRRARVTFA